MGLNMFFQIVCIALTHLVITNQALIDKTNDKTESRNYKQLLDFIQLLNTQTEKRREQLNDRNFIKKLENKGKIVKYKKLVGDEVNESLQNILRVAQKNYDTYEKNKELKSKDESGVIFISNPEVIEEYKTGFNGEDTYQTNTDNLRKSQLSSTMTSSSSASSTSDDSGNLRRNLKDMLQNMRMNAISEPSDGSGEFLIIKRRNQNVFPKRELTKDYSIEKAVWNDDSIKENQRKPKKKKDSSNAFDTNQHTSRNKKDLGPPKRPVRFQSKSKIKFDSYKPKKESYSKKRDDYRSYGRTSIPVVGNKAVYD